MNLNPLISMLTMKRYAYIVKAIKVSTHTLRHNNVSKCGEWKGSYMREIDRRHLVAVFKKYGLNSQYKVYTVILSQ